MAWRRACLAFACLALVQLACERGDHAPKSRPNIVVVVLDTVRADHLSLYGYERETTPNLDALAPESRVYDEAHSVSSWTAPSHASLFTGHYPSTHGLTREHRTLDTPLPTLAEVLAGHGYETFAVVSNAVVHGRQAFDRGFTGWREPWRDYQEFMVENAYLPEEKREQLARARGSLDRNNIEIIGEWLTTRDASKPFFLFSNLIGPHTPYVSAGPYQNLFDDHLARTPEREELLQRYGKSFKWYADYFLGRTRVDEDEIEFLVRHYDAELRYVDHQVGALVALLREHTAFDDTLFIVTSDHGEAHGEQGILGHEFVLSDVLTRIPLLIRYPARFAPGTREPRPVQILDLFATVLDIAGVDGFASQGVSLASDSLDPERPVFTELARVVGILKKMKERAETPDERRRTQEWDRSVRALICGDYKLVQASNGRHEFYDRKQDPGETRNLIDDPDYAPAIEACSEKLEALVERYTAERPPASQRGSELVIDPAYEEALRALGYVE